MKFKRLATILMAAAMMVSLVAVQATMAKTQKRLLLRAMMLWRKRKPTTSLWPKVGDLKISIQL